MTLLSKITIAFVAVIIVLLVFVFISLAADPAKKLEQFYEATMQGKCDDIDKFFDPTDYDAEQVRQECRKYSGSIDSYRIGQVERYGIPGILEWAAIDTEITFVDGKVNKGNQNLVKTIVSRWKITKIE